MSGVESMRAVQLRLVVPDDPNLAACTGLRAMQMRMAVVRIADMSDLMAHAPYLVLCQKGDGEAGRPLERAFRFDRSIERPALVARLRPTPTCHSGALRSLSGRRSAPNPGSPYWSGEQFQMGAAPAPSGQRSIVQAALAGAAAPARSDKATGARAMVFMVVLHALGFHVHFGGRFCVRLALKNSAPPFIRRMQC